MSTFNDLPRELQIIIFSKRLRDIENNKNYHINRFDKINNIYLTSYQNYQYIYKLKEYTLYLIRTAIVKFMYKNSDYIYTLDIDETELEEPGLFEDLHYLEYYNGD